MDEVSDHAPVGILTVTADGTVLDCNEAACEVLCCSPEETEGADVAAVFPDSIEATVPRAFGSSLEERRSIEEYYPPLDRWLEVTLVPVDEQVVVYVDDVTDRHHERRRTEGLRDDLDRLTVLNELISDILADLVDAASREEIADTICRRLGETDIYDFAWVAERELGGDDLVLRAAAGQTGRTLDEIESCLDDATVPEQRAIDSGESVIVQPIGDDEGIPESIRRAAFADGLQSLLAIPLTYGSSVYGVVGVYTGEQDAFSERERASFETVGEMAGFAINATRHRNLLLSDTVVELDLQVTDSAAPLVGAATETDTPLSLDGLVPQGEELLCYLVADDSAVSAVVDSLADRSGVRDTRLIGEYDEGGVFEARLGPRTPLGLLAASGVTVRSAEFGDAVGDIDIECSPEEDVRRLVDAVSREFEVDVLAKRERERDVTTAREFRDELRDKLTERQENALRTAFFAEYFQSPRGSNAQEVAEALDITGPTLLHHLRAGQRKLLEEFFDVADDS
ncbi:bacterio-opsin activator domain-containing protein [Halovenus salina]|uniref:bacterio-opsin activator domain-containing protein n=1 Tax=Halovenus salina TaxID=1510225 RepID=UPI002260A8C5|nr:bacterio-opsin activator domain-containing protein [Halovenus salina]